MHLYIVCVHYIRTHPYCAFVEREAENQEKKRHLDVADVVVVVVAAGGGGGGVAATTIANADIFVGNRAER